MALLHMHFYSNALGRNVQADVVLPKAGAPTSNIPTLFLLHGMTDDHTMWQRRTSIERYAEEHGLAVVMPDTKLGFYTNTRAGERYFDFISEELPLAVRRALPRLTREREKTYVAGLSMGGYGALKCALAHPETFSRVAALSSALDIVQLSLDPMPLGSPYCWADVFGPRNEIAGSENDLFALAENLQENRPEIWMWCGTEDPLYEMNLRLRDHLKKLGYSLQYFETPGGHFWKYWDREIENAICWLTPGEEDVKCL